MALPEYPNLPFAAPRAWGAGRAGKSVMYAVVHYTAGAERSTSAEDGAAYDQRRTDGVSTHFFHDSNSTVQCVATSDRANAAFHKGNRLGIQHELCGTAQTRAQWLDPASDATIDRAARQIAQDCRKYNLPVRRLTVAETRAAWYSWPNGPRGIVGHVDITHAYPEDGGSHTDPGTGFPWDVLLARVSGYLKGATPVATDDIVEPKDVVTAIAIGATAKGTVPGNTGYHATRHNIALVQKALAAVDEKLSVASGYAKTAAERPQSAVALTAADRAAIVADVLAVLVPAIVAVIPLALTSAEIEAATHEGALHAARDVAGAVAAAVAAAKTTSA